MAKMIQIGEITKDQKPRSTMPLISTFGTLPILSPLPAIYTTYREMRKDPTIALALNLGIAPIVAAEWSTEITDDAPEDASDFIEGLFFPIREPFLETSLRGCWTFGWQPFEKIFKAEEGRIVLQKLKPLIQDITDIRVEKETGAFQGFKQGELEVPLANSLLINRDVEGTQWHGTSLLENARAIYNEWREANAGAARYDKRIAGAHFVLYYPVGTSKDVMGAERQNDEIAKEILSALEASGSVAIPTMISGYAANLNEQVEGKYGWRIEIMEDKAPRQPTFIERLRYLDVLKVRALLLPERAIMEGEHGTKAEAGEHINLALTHAELVHRHITRLLNWHCVDQLLALNWGEQARGTVKLVASPIVDAKLQLIRGMYQAILTNPSGFLEEYPDLDMMAIRDALGIPQIPIEEQEEQDEEEENVKQPPSEGMDTNDPRGGDIRQTYNNVVRPGGDTEGK